MKKIRICSVSYISRKYNVTRNMNFFNRILEVIRNKDVDIVCFPEYFLQGFISNDKSSSFKKILENSIPVDPGNEIINVVCSKAKEININILFPLIENDSGRLYNSTVLISKRGKILGTYRKIHLCKSEELYLSCGNEFKLFNIEGAMVGIMICFDRQIAEMSRILALKGAELILNPSAGEYGEKNDLMMRTRASENRVFILFTHPKEGMVINPDGDIIIKKGMDENYIIREIDLDYVNYYRNNNFDWEDFYSRRKPSLYKSISRKK